MVGIINEMNENLHSTKIPAMVFVYVTNIRQHYRFQMNTYRLLNAHLCYNLDKVDFAAPFTILGIKIGFQKNCILPG